MSNNVTQTATRVSTLDGAPDPYDHEISLIDATASENPNEQRSTSPSPSWRSLAKKPTRSSLKGHLTQRKYAKWREGRLSSRPSSIVTEEDPASTSTTAREDAAVQTSTVDFARSEPVERGRKSVESRRRGSKYHKDRIQDIDILYENQRGSFFFGIPLYSHSSLLPIDPSPWVNKDFKQSPVNITNAQLPDPSWQWAWKSWYVDMSHDVDEEGWQYSFAFGGNFAWHGTHPWFHSFARRRRWLRKRVKKEHNTGGGKPGSLGAAHNLTGDYFTIHSKRDRSPISVVDGPGKTARPSSYVSYQSIIDINEPPEDIKDIASLLMALRFATIDREKIEVFKRFVDQGEEELVYLKDHIRDIMAFLVFQNSRRQLISYLKETANEVQKQQKHNENEEPEQDGSTRRTDNILAAVDAANAEIGGLEYWSDRKDILKTIDDESLATKAIATIFDEPAPEPKADDDPVKEIKGISRDAEVMEEKQRGSFTHSGQPVTEKDVENAKQVKGKQRADDSEDDRVENNSEASARLGTDQILIPDED